MSVRVLPCAVILPLVLSGLPALASPAIQPGGWKVKTVVTARETPASPARTVSEMNTQVCFTPAFLARDPYLTPGIDRDKMEKQGARCSISDAARSEASASWKMSCTMADGNSVEMQINNTVAPRRLRSEIQQLVHKGGQDVQIRITMDSVYAGACTKDMLQL
ncbi:DUF3617 domain-containing protein [Zoogloea sp.]|uniref:DUF3617 domain-containing protein n=1 Tax=Zoogloea sp. TaxID=49181 RepID=UPI0035B30181